MGSLLGNLPAPDYQNRIRVLYGGQSVGDHEASPALHQSVHGFLDLNLRPGVHIGGGLVQNQHGSVGQERPGNGNQLPLALGDVHAVV